MPVDARGLCLVMGLPPGRDQQCQGRAVQGAALASPPPLRGGATGAAAAARFAAPSRSARGPHRHERAEPAMRERPTSSTTRARWRVDLSPGEDQ
jgi:hypothetical protein